MYRVWLVLALTVSVAQAAPDQHIQGTVIDKSTAEPIEGALVVGASVAESTTATGVFAITLAADEVELLVTAPGYAMRVVPIGGKTFLRIELDPASGAEVVEVEGKLPVVPAEKEYKLTSDDLRQLPGTANDALRAAQALPGVSRLPYSFGGIVLRGTSPRDNAVYLDGVEVPFAFHFGGVTSFYPSTMLSSLTVSNGGLAAEYGRVQGGMVSLDTRDPRRDRWRKAGSVGLLDASALVEGPLKSGSILIGLRRSYFDIVAAPVAPDDVPLPAYWDAQVRTSFGDATKEGGHIAPMAFLSLDDIYTSQPGKDQFEDESSLRAFFIRVAAPYKRQWARQTLDIVPWIGTNQLQFQSRVSGSEESFERPVYLGGTRATLAHDYAWGELRSGVDLEAGHLSRFQAGFGHKGDIVQLVNGSTTVDWTDAALWSDARFKLAERLSLRPGARLEHYGLSDEVVLDPRVALHEQLTDTLMLREAVGRYHQPPTPGDVDPNGGNPNLNSSYVDAVSLGVDRELPEGWTGSLTGFYDAGFDQGVRTMQKQMNFANLGGLGPTFELLLEKQLGLAFYRENIGRSRSKGLELLIKHSSPKWFGMLAYTLSKSERTDDPSMGIGWRAFELDQRHNLNIAASIPLDKWRVGARIHVVSGTPVPAPLSGNLPVFFQLDIRADRKWPQCWGDVNFYADIQNVTNRRNIEGRNFDDETLSIHESRGLPIAPFIGVEMIPN